ALGLAALSVWGGRPAVALGEDPPSKGRTTANQIADWVQQLSASRFDMRDRATQALIQAGRTAIPAVLKAVQGTDREVALRSIIALQEIGARGDVDDLQAALQALESVSRQNPSAAVTRHATDALSTLMVVRQERAVEHLTRQGAVISHVSEDRWYNGSIGVQFATPVYSAEIGPQWRGTDADIERLTWVTDIEQVCFEGPQVKESWFQHLKALPRLHSVKVKRVPISNAGLRELAQLDGMWFLRLMYVPLDDTAVPILEGARGLRRLLFISRNLTEKGAEQLVQQLGKASVDCPRGALLGVESSSTDGVNWTVKAVVPGSAADKAGMLEGDRVVAYNGQPVTDFPSLRTFIARNEPGDTVTLEIERGLERLTKQVTFGEWD
ncbi:MAG: PDZ domain-containing protein, partial [Pirellulaceae bacterium]